MLFRCNFFESSCGCFRRVFQPRSTTPKNDVVVLSPLDDVERYVISIPWQYVGLAVKSESLSSPCCVLAHCLIPSPFSAAAHFFAFSVFFLYRSGQLLEPKQVATNLAITVSFRKRANDEQWVWGFTYSLGINTPEYITDRRKGPVYTTKVFSSAINNQRSKAQKRKWTKPLMIIRDSLINHPARADSRLMCVPIRNFPASNPSSRSDRRGRRYPARAIRRRIIRQIWR